MPVLKYTHQAMAAENSSELQKYDAENLVKRFDCAASEKMACSAPSYPLVWYQYRRARSPAEGRPHFPALN